MITVDLYDLGSMRKKLNKNKRKFVRKRINSTRTHIGKGGPPNKHNTCNFLHQQNNEVKLIKRKYTQLRKQR